MSHDDFDDTADDPMFNDQPKYGPPSWFMFFLGMIVGFLLTLAWYVGQVHQREQRELKNPDRISAPLGFN